MHLDDRVSFYKALFTQQNNVYDKALNKLGRLIKERSNKEYLRQLFSSFNEDIKYSDLIMNEIEENNSTKNISKAYLNELRKVLETFEWDIDLVEGDLSEGPGISQIYQYFNGLGSKYKDHKSFLNKVYNVVNEMEFKDDNEDILMDDGKHMHRLWWINKWFMRYAAKQDLKDIDVNKTMIDKYLDEFAYNFDDLLADRGYVMNNEGMRKDLVNERHDHCEQCNEDECKILQLYKKISSNTTLENEYLIDFKQNGNNNNLWIKELTILHVFISHNKHIKKAAGNGDDSDDEKKEPLDKKGGNNGGNGGNNDNNGDNNNDNNDNNNGNNRDGSGHDGNGNSSNPGQNNMQSKSGLLMDI